MKNIFSIWRAFLTEELEKKNNLDLAQDALENMGFNFSLKNNEIRVLVPNAERVSEMEKIKNYFVPLGYRFEYDSRSSVGTLKMLDRKNGNVFIVVKADKTPASVGTSLETKYENFINDNYQQNGISAKSAGTTSNSDLIITGPKGSMSIELKNSIGADFGQFKVAYNIATRSWSIIPTKSSKKNNEFFQKIFQKTIKPELDQKAYFADLDQNILNIRGNFILGLKDSTNTGIYKKFLEKNWFSGRADLKKEIDFELVSQYYLNKGDSFIQIEGKGLYALSEKDASAFGLPLFSQVGKASILRFRIKPHSSTNGVHSFTVAIKVDVAGSSKTMSNKDDLDNILSKIM